MGKSKLLIYIPFLIIISIGCIYGIEKVFNQLQIISSGIFLFVACIVSIVIFGFISTLICGLICSNNQNLFKASIIAIGLSCTYACIFEEVSIQVVLMIVGFFIYYAVTVNNIIKIRKSKVNLSQ